MRIYGETNAAIKIKWLKRFKTISVLSTLLLHIVGGSLVWNEYIRALRVSTLLRREPESSFHLGFISVTFMSFVIKNLISTEAVKDIKLKFGGIQVWQEEILSALLGLMRFFLWYPALYIRRTCLVIGSLVDFFELQLRFDVKGKLSSCSRNNN